MGSVAIEMINVEKRFGKVAAVNGVSLKILKSEILGLLGRNGAGKTTIVDMITKVTRPSAGTIKFNKNKVNDKEI
jgi:ABC-type multidrug transport system ATPase subunit